MSLPSNRYRLGRGPMVGLAAFTLGLLFFELGGARVLTYHETLFATPAKEMLRTGDWLVPRIAGQPSTHKPPGVEWVQALSMLAFGCDAEWVVRLPSALAGCVHALVVALLATRWFGRRTGVIAGLVQATTLFVLQLARLGEADMLLCAAVAVAMGAFATANVESPIGRSAWRGWPIVFFATATASYFFKGLMGPMAIFLGVGAYALLVRRRHVFKFLLHPLGILLMAGCIAGWFAAAVASYPPLWDDQIAHHFGRFRGDLGGGKAPYFYLWAIPLVLLPWSPLALLALVRGVRARRYVHPFWQFAACWVVPGLIVLSASTFKSKHYPAPLLAPAAILAALGFRRHVVDRLRGGKPSPAVAAALMVVLAAVAIGVVMWQQPRAATAIGALVGVGVLGALAAVICEVRRSRRGYYAAAFGTLFLVGLGVQGWVMPAFDSYRDQTDMARRAESVLPPETTLYLVGLPENQVVYYLSAPLERHDDPATFLAQPPPGDVQYVFGPASVGESLAALGRVETLDRSASINRYMTERDRLTFFRVVRDSLSRKPTEATSR